MISLQADICHLKMVMDPKSVLGRIALCVNICCGLQGVLTTEEQQTATEVNDMDIPINFVFEPIPLSLDPASTPRSSLAQHISPGPPNFSGDGSADRTDVLRWLSSSSNPWGDEPSGEWQKKTAWSLCFMELMVC